jgi:hypothetical protein
LTMPIRTLAAAERIARKRKVTLSTVVSEALEETLQAKTEAQREGQRRVKAWEKYRESVAGLSDEDRLLLDGIIMEPVDE